MGYFNVLKGAYPTLQQIDKTLAMKTGETGIVRGSALYIDNSGSAPEWALAGAANAGNATTPGAYLYYALQPQTDLQAAMAGNSGQGAVSAAVGQPRLTGISCGMPMEFQTDQYTGTLTAGQQLTVGADGKLVAHATGNTVYGQVTVAAAAKWVNNAVAVTGWRTGNTVNVITVRAMYLPQIAA